MTETESVESDKPRASKAVQKEADEKAKADENAAAEQAEQNESDVEAFLAAHRGEKLIRDANNGSLDHAAFMAARAADQERKDTGEDSN